MQGKRKTTINPVNRARTWLDLFFILRASINAHTHVQNEHTQKSYQKKRKVGFTKMQPEH